MSLGSTLFTVKPSLRSLPTRGAGTTQQSGHCVLLLRCFVLRSTPFKEPKYKQPNTRGLSWPRLRAQRPCSPGMKHKRFQLGLSTLKLGAELSLVQASEVSWSPLCGKDEREGGQKHGVAWTEMNRDVLV